MLRCKSCLAALLCRDCCDIIHNQHAIQVVHFVLHYAGIKIFQDTFLVLAFFIGVREGNFYGTGNGKPDVGEAETAFFIDGGFFAFEGDVGVDERCFLAVYPADANTQALAHLRCGKPYPIGGIHALFHIADQLQYFFGHFRYSLRFFAEDGVIGAKEDAQDGHGRSLADEEEAEETEDSEESEGTEATERTEDMFEHLLSC